MSSTEQRYWDTIADVWRGRQPLSERIAHVIASLACDPGSLVLDAGCGAGAFSIPLALHGYRVSGIDIAPRMIANAREAAEEAGLPDEAARFAVGDVEAIAFPEATFDAVLCFLVLDFAPHPGIALMEFWRVLKPGGRLLLVTLGAYSPVKHDAWRRFLPDNDAPRFHNCILPWEMEALLIALGWQIDAQQPFFSSSFAGVPSSYSAAISDELTDPVLLQTIATAWAFTAVKPAHPLFAGDTVLVPVPAAK